MKMKTIVAVFLVFALSMACKDDTNELNNCGVDDPLTELDWLAELAEPCDMSEVCLTSIYQGSYNEETVFYTMLSGALCDPAFYVVLLDCEGDTVKVYGWEDYENFEQEVTDTKVLYNCMD